MSSHRWRRVRGAASRDLWIVGFGQERTPADKNHQNANPIPLRIQREVSCRVAALELAHAAYAPDSTTIEACLSVFPWTPAMHPGCVGLKVHTLLDIRGAIATIISFSESRQHDVHMLDELVPEPGAIYLMDRAYLDFRRHDGPLDAPAIGRLRTLPWATPMRPSDPT